MNYEPNARRPEINSEVIAEARFGGVVCALPTNVLLLSGYWPVVGTSIVVAGGNGRVALVVPEDERHLAQTSWADSIFTFKPASLDAIYSLSSAVVGPLRDAFKSVGIGHEPVGFEWQSWIEPMPYIAINLYGDTLLEMLKDIHGHGDTVSADVLLHRLRSVHTRDETQRIETACGLAGTAFKAANSHLQTGRSETDVAAELQTHLSDPNADRSQGHISVMSGPRSAMAYGSFARSTAKRLERHELALVHCNSTVDGFWTDITRTFTIGEPDLRQQALYKAVFAARDAALSQIRPGAKASDVDRAAREVLKSLGFGGQFRHSTGHGVGFSAIDHNARPRLHPKSPDILNAGMVFNVEPAIYIEGFGGLRHCDMVEVTNCGVRLLTPFLSRFEDFVT